VVVHRRAVFGLIIVLVRHGNSLSLNLGYPFILSQQ
jgi:hypothetical protein